jgi:hypothetical protein
MESFRFFSAKLKIFLAECQKKHHFLPKQIATRPLLNVGCFAPPLPSSIDSTQTIDIKGYSRSSETILKFIFFASNKSEAFETLADYCAYLVLHK